MPRVSFSELPDYGRLWVFPASRDLAAGECEELLGAVDDFLDGWAAHGAPLVSARELRENRFLLVGVDVDRELPSGCSIDALVNRLRALGAAADVSLIEHASIWYRANGRVQSVSRPAFKALAQSGEVAPDGMVFDTTLVSVGALREGGLERRARDSWHGTSFFREQIAG